MWDQNHENNIFKLFAIYAELGEIITININMCEGGRSIQSGQNTSCVFYETVNNISFYNCARWTVTEDSLRRTGEVFFQFKG